MKRALIALTVISIMALWLVGCSNEAADIKYDYNGTEEEIYIADQEYYTTDQEYDTEETGSEALEEETENETSEEETEAMRPAREMPNEPIVSFAARASVSFVLLADNSLWAWGHNGSARIFEDGRIRNSISGFLGDGTTIERHEPVWIMDDVASFSVGGMIHGTVSVMAIKTEGTLWGFGANQSSAIGNGLFGFQESPVMIMDDVIFVHAGHRHTVAIKSDQTMWAWGDNGGGRIGGEFSGRVASPVMVMENVVYAHAAAFNTMVITTDGGLYIWGENWMYQLADSTASANGRGYPVRIMENVVSAAGASHIAALQADGTLWAWANNVDGQVGNGTTISQQYPVMIKENVRSFAVTGGVSLAVTNDDELWGWGMNGNGQLGLGDTNHRLTPTLIMENIQMASLGTGHAMATDTEGSLWAWGLNRNGQLGTGDTQPQLLPVRIIYTVD